MEHAAETVKSLLLENAANLLIRAGSGSFKPPGQGGAPFKLSYYRNAHNKTHECGSLPTECLGCSANGSGVISDTSSNKKF